MAETELILNTNLKTPSSSCISCHSSETNGQNLGLKGHFSDQLNGSINELANSSGEVLPIDGKILPHSILPERQQANSIQAATLKGLGSNFQSLLNGIQLEDIDSNTLNQIPLDILDIENLDLQDLINQFPEKSLQTISNVYSELEQNIDSNTQNISEIVSEISEEQTVIPSSINPTQILPTLTTHVDELTSVASVIDSQRTITTVSTSIDTDLSSNFNKSNLLTDETVNHSNPQKVDITDNTLDELNDYFAKYLSDDNNSKIVAKNHVLSSEVFQQNINIAKPESNQLNQNISNGVDAYNNLNTGSLINRPIEAPIPLLIKQGVAPEQIQQSVDQSIEQNVKWLMVNKAQHAKINVFPESLGQVNIALNLEDSNLKLNFIATSNVTKDLIESSVATLKSQFGESGINLQEVNVETRFTDQSNQDSHFSSVNDDSSSQLEGIFDATDDNAIELASLGHANKPTSLYLLDAYV